MKTRQTNIEILRILSMFMILVIHANMVSISPPTSMELQRNCIPTVMRCFWESLGIGAVDVFVLISGWFSIHPRLRSVSSFMFQILFFWGGGFVLMLILGYSELSMKNVLACFSLTKWDWFVKSYSVLLILAPVLNIFLETSTAKLQRQVVFWFFLFSSTYGWLMGASRFFLNGYGPLSFIGLYLLAGYVHKNIGHFNYDKRIDLSVFFIAVVLNTVIATTSLHVKEGLFGAVYAYNNPLVIWGGLHLLLFFSKLQIPINTLINKVAASSFAVYLLHSQVDIRPFFTSFVYYLYSKYNGMACISLIFVFLLLVFMISVLIDQIRICLWKGLMTVLVKE